MADNIEYQDYIFHLARLAIAGKSQDAQSYVRRIIRKVKGVDEEFALKLGGLAAVQPSSTRALRDAGLPMMPVDTDSRLSLLRQEQNVCLDRNLILPTSVQQVMDQVLAERRNSDKLALHGLSPSRSILFDGPPGVGKTLSARWLAMQLKVPLLTLDLSALMSSFLGRTGNNLRNVIDYAKTADCILFLDEFDAIAKRRDDQSEVGELKRLVTVILQEIDIWPTTSLLLAATNHGSLLDPAVWRRFDHVIEFSNPGEPELRRFIADTFHLDDEIPSYLREALAIAFAGSSYSEVGRQLDQARRKSAISGQEIASVVEELLRESFSRKPLSVRKNVAAALKAAGVSDRQNHRITGAARETIRALNKQKTHDSLEIEDD